MNLYIETPAQEMALDACEWDPEGGSAMRRGDIGAHHLLRGLNRSLSKALSLCQKN